MKKFEITKEQILELEANYNNSILKQWFPDAFKKELETGKWYKGENIFINIVNLKSNRAYGFNIFGEWENECDGWYLKKLIEATPQEVESALICEAKKRGYKGGDFVIPLWETPVKNWSLIGNDFRFDNNCLYLSSCIFKDGVWATIIETITIQEAEKLLNKKIV